MQRTLFFSLVIAQLLTVSSPTWAACDESQQDRSPTENYIIKGGEVYDKKNDLTWARCSVGQSWQDGAGCVGAVQLFTFDDAKKQPYDVWRLPIMAELETLIDPTCTHPSINEEVFPGMDHEHLQYWSSTQPDIKHAQAVHFSDGALKGPDGKDRWPWRLTAVRLVRSGH